MNGESIFNKFLNLLIKFVNNIFSSLSYWITDFNESSSGLDYMQFAKDYGGIFVTFAYALLILFFGIGVIQNAMTTELFTIRGGAKVFGQLLICKILIDLSGTICVAILDVCTHITKLIVDTDVALSVANDYGEPFPSVNIPVVGSFIELILAIIYFIPTLLMILAVGIAAMFVAIKIVMRTFQIGVLLTISPSFFACLASDATREYFKKFINAFLATALDIVFMAMIYAAGKAYLLSNNFFTDTSWSVVAIAMCCMMVKPPQFLRGLIN
jgi:hypothetical protein